jgi:hypothetical protein
MFLNGVFSITFVKERDFFCFFHIHKSDVESTVLMESFTKNLANQSTFIASLEK